MTLADALRASSRTYVARPGALLPFFVAGLAASMAAQVVLVLGLTVLAYYLVSTGRADEFLERVEGVLPEGERLSLEDVQSGSGPSPQELQPALEVLDTPTVWAILAATLIGIVLASLLASAVIGSGQLHAVYAVLTDRPAIRSGVDGVFRHGATFAGLALLELFALVGLAIVLSAPAGLAAAAHPLFGVLAGFVAGAVWLLAFVVLRLLFALARPAAVVDGVGVVGSLRGSAHYVRSEPLQAVGYGVVASTALLVVAVLAGLLSLVGASAPVSLVSALLVAPLIVVFKTVLYADWTDAEIDAPTARDRPLHDRFASAIRGGFAELLAFVRAHPLLHVLSVGVGLAGVAIGLEIGAAVDHVFAASIEYRIGRRNPVADLLFYAANNWSVVAAVGFSGFGFGVAPVVGLLFNGVNVGLLYGLEQNPRALLYFLVPHGVFELPAIFVSGALGLHLGIVAFRYAAGRTDREVLVEEFDRAYRVVLGLAVLIAIAAVLEAFVSPYYWRLLGL